MTFFYFHENLWNAFFDEKCVELISKIVEYNDNFLINVAKKGKIFIMCFRFVTFHCHQNIYINEDSKSHLHLPFAVHPVIKKRLKVILKVLNRPSLKELSKSFSNRQTDQVHMSYTRAQLILNVYEMYTYHGTKRKKEKERICFN